MNRIISYFIWCVLLTFRFWYEPKLLLLQSNSTFVFQLSFSCAQVLFVVLFLLTECNEKWLKHDIVLFKLTILLLLIQKNLIYKFCWGRLCRVTTGTRSHTRFNQAVDDTQQNHCKFFYFSNSTSVAVLESHSRWMYLT